MAAHLKPTDTRVDALVSGRRFKPTQRSDVFQNLLPLGKVKAEQRKLEWLTRCRQQNLPISPLGDIKIECLVQNMGLRILR